MATRPPTSSDLRAARDELAYLIRVLAPEARFQSLFARFPLILSEALPLRVLPSRITPLGRPGRSEPDFVVYPDAATDQPHYGVIELKRPSHHILTHARKNVIMFTQAAGTAIAQCQQYLADLRQQISCSASHAVALGNEEFAFIIMGLSAELTHSLVDSAVVEHMLTLLPQNSQILPYDRVLDRFSRALPVATYILAPPSSAFNVLIVASTDPMVSEAMSGMLFSAGYRTTCCFDYGSVARALQTGRVDCVVVCPGVPQSPGNLGAFDKLQQLLGFHDGGEARPVLYLLTPGTRDATAAKSLLRPTTDEQLQLPVALPLLTAVIEKLLGLRSERVVAHAVSVFNVLKDDAR